MKINLKDESNLVCVSISPHLTNDTLFIKEDFFPKKFNGFFLKRQQQNFADLLGANHSLVCIW